MSSFKRTKVPNSVASNPKAAVIHTANADMALNLLSTAKTTPIPAFEAFTSSR